MGIALTLKRIDDRYNRTIRIEDEPVVTRLAVDAELLQEAIESDSQAAKL